MDQDVLSSARRWLQGLWVCAAVVLAAACGGGVGTGGTGAFASGPITGFGSIIVGGVHFDDSAARVESDDGTGRNRSDLRLGTMVEVQSDEIRNGGAVASQVRIVSALIGRVQSVATGSLVINGQTVQVTAGTAFDEQFVGGLAGVAVGRVVEVYGFVTPPHSDVAATRIEPKDGAAAFKFRGIVAALDTQARTFDIGQQHFTYGAALGGTDALRNGALVRVVVGTQPDAQGRWVVSSVGTTGPGNVDKPQVKARGVITSFGSNASFTVDGFIVDASAAQITGGPLASGLRVEVDGRLQAGVLIASKVDVEDPNQPDEIQVNGVIDTIDPVAKVFTTRGHNGERVSYARPDIVWENGSEADLRAGRPVHVTGQLSADGTLVEATHIRVN